MDKSAGLYLFLGGLALWAIICGIVGWKLYKWRRKRWLKTLNNSERKRWQRLEQARISHRGYKKGFAIVVCAMITPLIIARVFHIPIPQLMMFFVLLLILLLIPHIYLVFKRKNKNDKQRTIPACCLCIGKRPLS